MYAGCCKLICFANSVIFLYSIHFEQRIMSNTKLTYHEHSFGELQNRLLTCNEKKNTLIKFY